MNGSVRIRFIRVEEINQIVWTQKELRSNGHLIYVKANQDSKSIQERITTIFSETLAYCWALGCKPSAYSTEFAPLTTLHDPVSDSASRTHQNSSSSSILMVSLVQLFGQELLLWTVACHTSLSMEFSRQEYWSELPLPPPGGIFLTQGLNPRLLCLLH